MKSAKLKKTTAAAVRGFLSGTVGKKLGLKLASAKGDDGVHRYSIEV